MKNIMICVLLAVFWGVINSLSIFNEKDVLYFSDIVLAFGMSDYEMHVSDIINISIRMFPMIIFQSIFGTYIYKHFCSASIYYFSRCINRVKWFIKEALYLIPYTIIFSMFIVLSGTGIICIRKSVIFDWESIIIFLYYICIYSMWLYFTTLILNLLAIKTDSSIAFAIISVIQLGFTALFLIWNQILPIKDGTNIIRNVKLLQCNPMAHLMIKWHSSQIKLIDERINLFGIDFNLNVSVLFMFVLSIVTIVSGCFIIKNHDLLTANKETGGSI